VETWGVNLFTLSFPPTHGVKMVFATRGVKVVLPGEDGGRDELLNFLHAPPQEFFALLGRVVAHPGGKGLEVDGVGLGDGDLGALFGSREWSTGVRVEFPPAFSQFLSGLKALWAGLPVGGKGRPFSYRFSVEREGREVTETAFSLFRGGDLTTVVDPGALSQDLVIHAALVGCFLLVWGRLLERVVALLRLLRAMGVIIFF